MLKALSLFSGAGGMDIGVDSAGYKTVCSIEVDPHCAATLRLNARSKTVWQVDVRALDVQGVSVSLDLEPGELQLLYGGPPCQPFSQIGKKRGFADPRGELSFEMVRFAAHFRPAAIFMEQVPRFLKTNVDMFDAMEDVLAREFHRIGYEMHAGVLDASEFGVPQKRKRAIVVCTPIGAEFSFPEPRSSKPPNVGDAIGDLPPAVVPDAEPLVPNHIDITPPRDRERISYVPEGQWLSKAEGAPASAVQRLTRKDTTKFRRLDRTLPSLTLRCGEALYHPTEDRYLTPRESARIQGFADNHVFVGPIRRRSGSVKDLDQHRQVANAVPPPLAKVIASSIAQSLCLA